MRVVPVEAVPRLMVTYSRMSLWSPISHTVFSPANFRSCGRHDTEAAVWTLQQRPRRAPSGITAPGPIQQPSPITTSAAMQANGSTVTSAPSLASGWT